MTPEEIEKNKEKIKEIIESLQEHARYVLLPLATFNDNLTSEERKGLSVTQIDIYNAIDIFKEILAYFDSNSFPQNSALQNENTKDYTKYSIILKNGKKIEKISKRNLLTEVIKYLIGIEALGMYSFDRFFAENSFGRVFAKNKPDMIYGCEVTEKLPETDPDYRHYNKVDFSKYPDASNNGVMYIANSWEKESIEKLIKYLNDEYKEIFTIEIYKKEG